MPDLVFEIERLAASHPLQDFNCGSADLNDFLINDAFPHQKELLAVTYLINIDSQIAAFYSLSNDIVSEQLFESPTQFKKFRKRKLPERKRYRHLPAVKLGRLGVDQKFSGQGIGSRIIDILKHSFTVNNKTGCRFITIDAYNNHETLNFYLKNDFEFFTKEDEKQKTRSMYFDLIRIEALKN